jgi:hypothetical protein
MYRGHRAKGCTARCPMMARSTDRRASPGRHVAEPEHEGHRPIPHEVGFGVCRARKAALSMRRFPKIARPMRGF